MNEREELEETLDTLRFTFEKLKGIRNKLTNITPTPSSSVVEDMVQELIWKIGEQLGEF